MRKLLCILTAFYFAPQIVVAQTTKPNTVVPPQIIGQCRPDYPKESMRREETGIVRVAYKVANDGTFVTARILIGNFKNLEQSVLDKIQSCKFQAGTHGGKPTELWNWMDFDFSLDQPSSRDREAFNAAFSGMGPGRLASINSIKSQYWLASAPRAVAILTQSTSDKIKAVSTAGDVASPKSDQPKQETPLPNSSPLAQITSRTKALSLERTSTTQAKSSRKSNGALVEDMRCASEEAILLASIINKPWLEANDDLKGPPRSFGTAYNATDICLIRGVMQDLSRTVRKCNPAKADIYEVYASVAVTWISENLGKLEGPNPCKEMIESSRERWEAGEMGDGPPSLSVNSQDALRISEASRIGALKRAAKRNGTIYRADAPPSPGAPPALPTSTCDSSRLKPGEVCTAR